MGSVKCFGLPKIPAIQWNKNNINVSHVAFTEVLVPRYRYRQIHLKFENVSVNSLTQTPWKFRVKELARTLNNYKIIPQVYIYLNCCLFKPCFQKGVCLPSWNAVRKLKRRDRRQGQSSNCLVTLYNVCSVPWGSSVPWGISWVPWGISSFVVWQPWGISWYMWGISWVPWGYSDKKRLFPTELNIPTVLKISPTCIMIFPHDTEHRHGIDHPRVLIWIHDFPDY